MNTCLMVTVAMSLIARQFNLAFRWPAAIAGLIATGWFSAYCVAPYIHPSNEALAGGLLGAVAALAFLWRIDVAQVDVSPSLIGAGLVVVLLSALAPKYNAERLLNHLAVSVSGGATPPTRSPRGASAPGRSRPNKWPPSLFQGMGAP